MIVPVLETGECGKADWHFTPPARTRFILLPPIWLLREEVVCRLIQACNTRRANVHRPNIISERVGDVSVNLDGGFRFIETFVLVGQCSKQQIVRGLIIYLNKFTCRTL